MRQLVKRRNDLETTWLDIKYAYAIFDRQAHSNLGASALEVIQKRCCPHGKHAHGKLQLPTP
eukprot:6074816-Pyramimonas_sp.AAC.1